MWNKGKDELKQRKMDINSINGLTLQHVERDPTCYEEIAKEIVN